MPRALKTLRVVRWSMLGSIALYALVGEVLGPRARTVDSSLSYIFSSLAVGVVGAIFVVRRTLVFRAATILSAHPSDAVSIEQWRTGYIVTYGLCEALGLFGVVLRFQGCAPQQSALFYVGGFVLLLFFHPRQPVQA